VDVGSCLRHRQELRALIVMGYHSIEKGLSLRQPRPGFGKDNAELLAARIEEYQARTGRLDSHARIAVNALRAYCDFNEKSGVVSSRVRSAIARMSGTLRKRTGQSSLAALLT